MPNGTLTGQVVNAAAGSTPWGAAIQGAAGLAQTIGGFIQQHKATKDLNKLINSYSPNSSILDYYSKALNKYNLNPYTSSLYKNATNQAQKGLATGLNYLQDRRSALAGVGSLVQQYDDNALKAAAAAEGQQSQDLGRLGQATEMKAREEKYPFEMKYNLLSQKAGGGSQVLNSGLSNIFGAGSSASQMAMLKKMYSNP